eukprot:TRINITY_DN8918_c0_g1_i1.p1 TRINITY_DN8918_c0_g1~~TRINITY_DN8918_c0_g1_i1.p1  ORF type:complete len:260 (+),score=41.01 TRINITY_DN8918_c0_g1_i1:55-834(+)
MGLESVVCPSKAAAGLCAARHVGKLVRDVASEKGAVNMIFATGASQLEFLAALTEHEAGAPWAAVTAYHLDEYVGMDDKHPASFRRYLTERLFSLLPFGTVHLLDPSRVGEYDRLLRSVSIDIACIGIGENAHLAFNDPPAVFEEDSLVKVVQLDEACRRQQVGEGWFQSLAETPTQAVTLTIPAIMRAARISCVVPDERKAAAVQAALEGPVDPQCPGSVLRKHPSCVLWLDHGSASRLSRHNYAASTRPISVLYAKL